MLLTVKNILDPMSAWKYALETSVYEPKKNTVAILRPGNDTTL